MPDGLATAWTFYYAVVWGFVLLFSGMLISLFATRRFAATYFTALMLSWLIGGIGMAICMSAAGPIFAHIADPALAAQFRPLHAELSRLLASDDLVLTSQRYLEAAVGIKVAVKGGGISAMPSMHTGWSTWCAFVLVPMFRRRWAKVLMALYPAATVFCIMITANHYWLDAVGGWVALAIGWLIGSRLAAWRAAQSFRRQAAAAS
jgi:hypothetical protein